jgi:hypothetical protein
MLIKTFLKELPRRLADMVKIHIQFSTIILAIIFTAGIWYALSCNGLQGDVINAIEKSRYDLFSVIASISGSLLGFSLASVSIIIAVFDKVSPAEENRKPEPIMEGLLKSGEEDDAPNPFLENAKNRKNKLQILKKSKHYTEIYSSFIFSAKVLAITTITSIMGMLFNINSIAGQTIIYFLSFLIMLSIFNVLWCIIILDSIVKMSLENKALIDPK